MRSVGKAMSFMERIIKSKIRVEGAHNLSNKPTLFVVNHFTRAETFVVPYVIHKHTGKLTKSLGHHTLFKGVLGKILPPLGVISTKTKNRNDVIIGDLMSGKDNWVIYPEGGQVKGKKIVKKGKYSVTTLERVGPPRTGASLLAIQAEMYKRKYLKALSERDTKTARELERRFNISGPADISGQDLQIIPVNITYYPLRPGQNIVKRLVKKFCKDIPPILEEELEIEGNLFLKDTDISIYFSEPITVADYCEGLYFKFFSFEKNSWFLRQKLAGMTNDFMEQIYSNLEINYDHLFCYVLREHIGMKIKKVDMYRICYSSFREIRGRFRTNPKSLNRDTFLSMLEKQPPDIVNLAKELGYITEDEEFFHINKLRLAVDSTFNSIRVRNPVVVIANEFASVNDAAQIVKKNMGLSSEQLAINCRQHLVDQNLEFLSNELDEPYNENAQPFLLLHEKRREGIVLCHGFLSCPREMKELAYKLHEKGYNVYVTRLAGHGTQAEKMKDCEYQDWIRSYKIGIAVMQCFCDKIILGGFSTGGALALWCSAESHNKVIGNFAINPPVVLQDIKSNAVGLVILWNKIVRAIGLSRFQFEKVENNPTYKDTNYKSIYLKPLYQLKKFMKALRKRIGNVSLPSLIFTSQKDPTVHPKSSKIIYQGIEFEKKCKIDIASDKHVLVRDENSVEKIANDIVRFFNESGE
jgi:esterase/lipase/1-acyl-sn-glycerol-3-phosphate acyltransferase